MRFQPVPNRGSDVLRRREPRRLETRAALRFERGKVAGGSKLRFDEPQDHLRRLAAFERRARFRDDRAQVGARLDVGRAPGDALNEREDLFFAERRVHRCFRLRGRCRGPFR